MQSCHKFVAIPPTSGCNAPSQPYKAQTQPSPPTCPSALRAMPRNRRASNHLAASKSRTKPQLGPALHRLVLAATAQTAPTLTPQRVLKLSHLLEAHRRSDVRETPQDTNLLPSWLLLHGDDGADEDFSLLERVHGVRAILGHSVDEVVVVAGRLVRRSLSRVRRCA